MKTYLLTINALRKAISILLLILITSTTMYAQQVYVNNQNFQVYGLCDDCTIINADDMIGNNENNYATLQMPLGVFGRIEQNLFFPSVSTYSTVVIRYRHG
ncbi:hypothetical protein [Chryseobacterium sp. BIGb0232]|uniref:hypothetical protein n=1 Tax=Chryseobacterium sp. BIGb0232 TaxID=2940598 RepID=UPI000F482B01|nr:hypothetical protein [Chryseobacterium sp. BIGb0232]MCS4302086.1 hypothetical protein [Chryseobacterium sp. BIGb0232]ROS18034.1 hypothetical protein EDF65_2422 [Chryseobacterium nakagawai]